MITPRHLCALLLLAPLWGVEGPPSTDEEPVAVELEVESEVDGPWPAAGERWPWRAVGFRMPDGSVKGYHRQDDDAVLLLDWSPELPARDQALALARSWYQGHGGNPERVVIDPGSAAAPPAGSLVVLASDVRNRDFETALALIRIDGQTVLAASGTSGRRPFSTGFNAGAEFVVGGPELDRLYDVAWWVTRLIDVQPTDPRQTFSFIMSESNVGRSLLAQAAEGPVLVLADETTERPLERLNGFAAGHRLDLVRILITHLALRHLDHGPRWHMFPRPPKTGQAAAANRGFALWQSLPDCTRGHIALTAAVSGDPRFLPMLTDHGADPVALDGPVLDTTQALVRAGRALVDLRLAQAVTVLAPERQALMAWIAAGHPGWEWARDQLADMDPTTAEQQIVNRMQALLADPPNPFPWADVNPMWEDLRTNHPQAATQVARATPADDGAYPFAFHAFAHLIDDAAQRRARLPALLAHMRRPDGSAFGRWQLMVPYDDPQRIPEPAIDRALQEGAREWMAHAKRDLADPHGGGCWIESDLLVAAAARGVDLPWPAVLDIIERDPDRFQSEAVLVALAQVQPDLRERCRSILAAKLQPPIPEEESHFLPIRGAWALDLASSVELCDPSKQGLIDGILVDWWRAETAMGRARALMAMLQHGGMTGQNGPLRAEWRQRWQREVSALNPEERAELAAKGAATHWYHDGPLSEWAMGLLAR